MADLKNGSTSLKSNNLLKDGIEKYGIERERERERAVSPKKITKFLNFRKKLINEKRLLKESIMVCFESMF